MRGGRPATSVCWHCSFFIPCCPCFPSLPIGNICGNSKDSARVRAPHNAPFRGAPDVKWGPPVPLFATIFSFPPLLSLGSDVRFCSTQVLLGGGESRANDRLRVFRAGAPRLPHEFWLGGSDMSFQVVRHEHPNILVVNRQTYETYRLTVGEDGLLVQNGAGSDLREAHRAAMAFMARSEKERGSR